MKLRDKTLVIVISTCIVLEIALYFGSRYVLMSGFSKLEHTDTDRNVGRVLDAFAENINNLNIKAADWSKWDDTYNFIDNHNEKYVRSNLNDESIAELRLNIMLFLNNERQVVFGREYDLLEETGKEIDASVLRELLQDSIMIGHKNEMSVFAGLIMLPAGPMTIVSRPILTSEGKGPVRGTIIFGRYLDSIEIKRIAQITHLTLQVQYYNDPNLPDDIAHSREKLSGEDPIYTAVLNERTIAGYTFLPDIHHNPLLLIRVDIQRDIYEQGWRTMVYLVVAILIAGLIFGLCIIVLLEITVLSRVARLNADVTTIGTCKDHSLRVNIQGVDELAELATSMNCMLEALQQSEQVVVTRNREMRLIMNTVRSGLLSLDEQFRINPEYSQSVETILGQKHLAGKSYIEALGFDQRHQDDLEKLLEFLEVFLQELLPEDDLARLNPFEELRIKTENRHLWIRLRYHLIKRGDNLPRHILVVLEDITEEKTLAEKVKRSEQENLQLKAIAEDPDLFRDFFTEMRQTLTHSEESLADLLSSPQPGEIIREMFRDIHTIKGTAGSFGLTAISEIAGNLEESLSALRESATASTEGISTIKESLKMLWQEIRAVAESTREILGDEHNESNDIQIRVSAEKLMHELSIIKEVLSSELIDTNITERLQRKIAYEFMKLRTVPARRGLAKALRIVPALIKRLEKDVSFHLDGGDTAIDFQTARELSTPLIHLIRNAFDHGIEPVDVRLRMGKNEQGRVEIKISSEEDHLIIVVQDDGRGLDPELLKQFALHKGMLSQQQAATLSNEDAYELIFRPGFSTARGVNDISGRGIGMDVVLASVRDKLQGEFFISSQTHTGTAFTIKIPVNRWISLPE